MRKDMNKVLTERPRAEGRGKQRKTYDKKNRVRQKRYFKGAEVDFSPKKESMRKRHKVGGDYKKFTDLIGPLERFLVSRVGTPWDDVWSEICQVLRGNGLQAAHVKGHVKDMVYGISHSNHYHYLRDPNDYLGVPGRLYVDEKGVLCRVPERKRFQRSTREHPNCRTRDGKAYHRKDGAWFEVSYYAVFIEYQKNPDHPWRQDPVPGQKFWDQLYKKRLSLDELKELYGRHVAVSFARSLDRKEIERLGLRK